MVFEWLRFWKRKSPKKIIFNELQELEKAASVISNRKLNGQQRIELGITHLMAAKVHEERLKAVLKDSEKEEAAYEVRFSTLFKDIIGKDVILTEDQQSIINDMRRISADLKAVMADNEKRVRVDIDRWIAVLQIAKRNLDRKGNIIGDSWDKILISISREITKDIMVCESELRTKRINEISLERTKVRLKYLKARGDLIDAYNQEIRGIISNAAKRKVDRTYIVKAKQLQIGERKELEILDKELRHKG